MLRAIQIVSFQQSISGFFRIRHHFIQRRISSNKLAEIIISSIISFLAEIYRTLDHGYFIFILNSLFIGHLKNNISLSESQISYLFYSQIIDSRDKFQILIINLLILITCSSQPVGISGLTILLCQFSKVRTTFNGIINTVGQCFCFGSIFCIYLNLTEFD